MLDLLWLVPLLPLVGFLLLVLFPLPKSLAGLVGVGSIGASAVLTLFIVLELFALPAGEQVFRQVLWTWIEAENFTANFAFYLDPLTAVMMCIITGIGFLIHLYSVGYMDDDPGFARFFSYMNLFVASMLVLVMGDNLVVLFLGWEGVGLCSYLLIGFWYDSKENGYAARKAFVVTRAGDTSMALGMFLLFLHLGTLDIQQLMVNANAEWQIGGFLPTVAAALLLGGALGKSAQLPLQTWLPDAMAGPTPISALIHAATMVTAGVYLIARTHGLFLLAPDVMYAIAVIGAITLFISGFTALTQTDIKRILAFSTMSQLGYMFLALGVGAWSAAIFHLMTHAFFKALLFLAAGSVILCMHHEQDIFKMGGLRKRLPIAFLSFMIGGLALVAVPFTSGYYSKHEILFAAAVNENSGQMLWLFGVLAALMTGIYTFRLIFIVFFGKEDTHAKESSVGWTIKLPLLILCVPSVLGGFITMPLDNVLPAASDQAVSSTISLITDAMPFIGIFISYLLFQKSRTIPNAVVDTAPGRMLQRFWYSGWGFDWLYQKIFICPFMLFVKINKNDIVDSFYKLLAWLSMMFHRLFSVTQTGRLQWYIGGIAIGVILLVGAGVSQ